MENTPYQRLELFWLSKGLKNMSAFAEATGLKAATISAIKQRGSRPSSSVLRAIQEAFPDLDADYILWGETGAIRRLARETHPAPPDARPPALTSAAATIDHATELLLRSQMEERIKELSADKARLLKENNDLREENKLLLGKPFDSPDAADDSEETPVDPKSPRGRGVQPMLRRKVGFRTSYSE